jgi:hypothetical protein
MLICLLVKVYIIVINKSFSMYENEFEENVRRSLNTVKDFLSMDNKHSNIVQTAITLFGSTIEMRPFKYAKILIHFMRQVRLFD